MFKFLLCFGLISSVLVLTKSQSDTGVECLAEGSSVYTENQTTFLLNLGARLTLCKPGQRCGKYSWINTDSQGFRSFVENGFCVDADETYNCDILPTLPLVGEVENCTTTICSTDECNRFLSPVCNFGSAVYTLDRRIAIFTENLFRSNCQIGQSCGMYRWINTDENGFLSYVETGVCDGPNTNNSCSVLPTFPDVGMVSDCSFETCPGNQCEEFSIDFPERRGFNCSRGIMIYTTDRTRLVETRELDDDPCPQWEACAMYRWINTDGDGTQRYVEYGFCLDVILIPSYTCEALPRFQDVGEVENCTFEACSGDNCQSFTEADSSSAESVLPTSFAVFASLLLAAILQF